MAPFWRYLVAGIGLTAMVLGVLAVVYMTAPNTPPAAAPETGQTRGSEKGMFVATFVPQDGAARQNELQDWVLTLKTATGKPVENATVEVSGGMPQHAHGLPTSPKMTDYLGEGRYRISGVKFSMSGWWQLKLGISAPTGSDTVVFNIVL
ncbi:FixH family protein [Mesorhizobium retamae]|uniref:FixH family protein n=1 Tax=Mesorhizobium retamae TaxID=2912854 RepID=A0ABS9QEA6_9HYPH|nr:FixH family protein [Mesorhizobium sp. IRAMC:0171]MCG7505758.1 FixH family protein [Mesorhizobium sp. IRAMC:0171]